MQPTVLKYNRFYLLRFRVNSSYYRFQKKDLNRPIHSIVLNSELRDVFLVRPHFKPINLLVQPGEF
jgi:hypothetical protein